LRLQGLGAEVTVVEQRPAPGGRAYRLRDAGFTWDTGPSLLTMPWVLEETFAAGGLDLHAELTLRRLDPLYPIRWAGEGEALDFSGDRARLRGEGPKVSVGGVRGAQREGGREVSPGGAPEVRAVPRGAGAHLPRRHPRRGPAAVPPG